MRYLLSEIAAVCGGRHTGVDFVVGRVVTDSRSEYRQQNTGGATGGESEEVLFVAIRTPGRDGAAYIGELYARGVRGFLVSDDFAAFAEFPLAGFVAVGNTLAALQSLAAHYRGGFSGRVVGITGSTGKTTVKEWIAQLAPAGVSLFRSPRSWNSGIGVPLSVLMALGNEDYIVIEAGISEPGEMAVLERIIRPDAGILTCVGGSHDSNFASPAALRAEKNILFRACPALLCGDAGIVDFRERNSALAAAFWRGEGYDISPEAIAALEPVAMRLEVKEGLHDSVIINDTYNSDVSSLAIALDHLARQAASRPRVVVMPEDPRAAAMVSAAGVERLIQIGPRFSVDEALRTLTSSVVEGRAILIRGGSGMGFDRIERAIERRSHTTVLEVDLDAMIRNLRLCRDRLAPRTGIMPMIKANAYGHGAFEVARALAGQGVDYLAVAFADEGVALREAGITTPMVVLNADADSFEPMIRHRLEPEIYNFVSLDRFVTLLKRHGEHLYPIHIKLDTGMHRLGFRAADIPELVARLSSVDRYIRVATVFSHLAAADDPAHDSFTCRQISDFDTLSRTLTASLSYPVRRHIAGSAGIVRFPEASFDMVRLGIGLYGFGAGRFEPVASLGTRIVHIEHLDADQTVGYGRCGKLVRPSLVATIPIGYADGLDRHLGNGGWSVLVGRAGERSGVRPAPTVGNICMDSCMIDITDMPDIGVGDRVTIFSAARGNTAADMAAVLGTIPYEVLTSVSTRVKRIYTNER